MAAAFRPVNSPLAAEVTMDDKMTTSPTTPRSSTAPHPQTPQPLAEDAKTPTKATFGSGSGSSNAGLASQKPLPSSPFPQAVQVPESAEKAKTPTRANSQHSRKSRDSEDVDMDESDGETGAGDDGASEDDDDSVNADGTRSNKKKKSQRFYCTDYPPCNLSFTRSEHLARHIRKHTGERPFQCHCSRRFSRLDNLRQHAQTVHVNEDIPIDSLAATGARFQRQMRTERVRQQGGRARASTAGSATGPVRGHSKSLSTSSIASVGSIGSAFGVRDDIRRRPPPLVMADPRSRLSLESYRNAADGPYGYRPVSPTDYSTPTSATFSTGQSSPRWGSGIASPTTSHSRSHSMYSSGSRTPGRRLSVPSGVNPFQSPHGTPVNRLVYGAGPVNSSNMGAFSPAPSSHLASPTTPTSGWSARRDSTSSAADEAWRRRTWHPDTRNFNTNTSHLSNVLTPGQIQPNPAPPIANAPNPQQTLRLPGIESFDPLLPRQLSPPRRIPSPMMVDSEAAHPRALLPGTDAVGDDRRNVAQWDMGLHRGLTRLDITSNTTPPRDSAGAWANEVNQAVQAQAEQVRLNPPTVRFDVDPPSYSSSNAAFHRNHQHTMSAPSIAHRDTKRHGWYHGPGVGQVHGPRPEAPVHDPRGPHVNRMVHPNMNAFPGFPGRQADAQPPQQQQPGKPDPLRRLEALVAVATSEGTTATAY
ncbi:hypothetical protein EsH8_I_000249 [Colletotrichum jinshuiense]